MLQWHFSGMWVIVHNDSKRAYAASSCTYYRRTAYITTYIYYTTRIPRTLLHEPRAAAATATGPSPHSPFPSPRIRTRPAQIDKNTLPVLRPLPGSPLPCPVGRGVFVWREAFHCTCRPVGHDRVARGKRFSPFSPFIKAWCSTDNRLVQEIRRNEIDEIRGKIVFGRRQRLREGVPASGT